MFMSDQDESRNSSHNEVGSSSKNAQDQREEESWLQLSIGNGNSTITTTTTTNHVNPTPKRGHGLIELDLLPGGGSSRQLTPEFRAPLPPPPPPSYCTSLFFHQDINWGFRTMSQNITLQASSSSSSLMPPGSYVNRSFQAPIGIDIAGTGSEFRIMDAPRKHHTGIWFLLQASTNQVKQPSLPQIPRSYLRIKDARIQVRLVSKYLVYKLRLDNESEVEITCRGQKLQPSLTLQHVRDNIWRSKDSLTLLNPDSSSTADHIMLLHYGRIA